MLIDVMRNMIENVSRLNDACEDVLEYCMESNTFYEKNEIDANDQEEIDGYECDVRDLSIEGGYVIARLKQTHPAYNPSIIKLEIPVGVFLDKDDRLKTYIEDYYL